MRLANVIHLYRIRLRQRLVHESLALVGIAVGVALMFAALVASSSLNGSVNQLTSGIVGQARLQLAGRSPDGLDAALLPQVRALPGVKDAAPILEERAIVRGPDGSAPVLLLGGDPRFVALGGSLLQSLSSSELAKQQAIALPAPIAREVGAGVASRVRIVTGAATFPTTVGAQLSDDEIGSLVNSPVALAPLAYVQQLTALPNRVTRIFVQPRPGQDARVRAGLQRLAAGRLDVLPGEHDGKVFAQAALPTNQSTALFSVFAALVGFLFAVSAVLLTVPQRRRFIADLRICGHTPAVVAEVMAFDALVLGAAGAALGLLVGDQLSRHLFTSVPGYLAWAFPIGSERVVAWSSIAIPAVAGVLAAGAAVLAPIREIFARRPAQHARLRDPRRTAAALVVGGASCLIVCTLVLLLAPSAALGGMALLTVALLLLLPVLLYLGIEGLAWLGRFVRSAIPAIAAMELRSRASRTRMFSLAATGAVAVFASVAIGGAHADLQRGLDASVRGIDADADLFVSFPGVPNAFGTTPFHVAAGTLERVEQVAGVAAVRPGRAGFLDVGARRLWVLAPPRDARVPLPASQLVAGDVATATRRIRDGGWVALSQAVADDLHVGVGDRVALPTPVPTTLRVAALTTNIGWAPGAMILNADDYARAWGSEEPSALLIDTTPGASPAAVKRGVDAALATTSAAVETRAERMDVHYAASRQGLQRLSQILALVLVAAILAMAIAMGGVVWQRRPSLGSLKVDGFTEGELWRGLLLESAVLLGGGCLIGALFGLGGQVLLDRTLRAVTGFPVFYAPAIGTAAAIFALVLLAALAILAVPGRIAVNVRPASGAAG
ncbi:MAG TPA: ABC transporter permease [Conexibacter sp.]